MDEGVRVDKIPVRSPNCNAFAQRFVRSIKHECLRRLIFVGGAGSLELSPGKMLLDMPGFSALYKPEAQEGSDALDVIRAAAAGLDWSFISPAAEMSAGLRTGRYRATGDLYIPDARGQSRISFEDYAVALIDELEHRNHVGKRFGVAY